MPPTIIELKVACRSEARSFRPVLHVIRFKREKLDQLIDDTNATGYGLNLRPAYASRCDHRPVLSRVEAGNLYVNRNIIGAVVGVQPFGGRGLSGTGPKAGGPLYLGRLTRAAPAVERTGQHKDQAVLDLAQWLDTKNETQAAEVARTSAQSSALGFETELAGPVGERNVYALHPRGKVLLAPVSDARFISTTCCSTCDWQHHRRR